MIQNDMLIKFNDDDDEEEDKALVLSVYRVSIERSIILSDD